MEQEKEIDIKELFFIIMSKLYIIIILSVLGFGVAFCYAKFVKPLEYTSSVNMYVRNSNNTEQVAETIDNQAITTSRNLVETYIVVLSDTSVMKQISEELLKTYSAQEVSEYLPIITEADGKTHVSYPALLGSISMSSVNQTEVLNISVKTGNAQLSADICDIMSKIAPAELARVVGATSAETIGTAEVPLHPSGPNITKFAIIGFLGGFVIAFVIILIGYFMDNTVTDGLELKEKCDIAVLGEIPDIFATNNKKGYSSYGYGGYDTASSHQKEKDKKEKKEKQSGIAKKKGGKGKVVRSSILTDDLPFAVVEAYKSLRTNLIFATSTVKSNIVEISSCNAAEGKSTTSINVAICFAQNGQKAILVDCDLRKPVDHRSFNLENKKGITTIMSGETKLEDSIHKEVAPNLDFLCAGPTPPNPAEMLGSDKMKEMLEKLSKEYDYVFVDTPPINVVSDALVFSGETAGIVLVCKQSSTSYDDINRYNEKCSLANANNLGAVITNCQLKSTKRKYGYSYAYKY